VPRWLIRLELAQGRWCTGGRQTLVLHNGPLTEQQRRWVALLEVGSRASLAGITALQQAGLRGLDEQLIHVITPKGSTPGHPPGVRVHESRRFREEDVTVVGGLRCVAPPAAAVQAALWASTDRQATLFVSMSVQQRLTPVSRLHDAVLAVRRHPRRRLLLRLVADLAGGSQTLGELDVVAALRRRGLPQPEQQAIRRRPSGVEYLDCDFPAYEITLEIDGAGHDEPLQQLADLVRDIALTAEGRSVIRLPMIAWRLDEEQVLDSLETLFRARGWRSAAA
jgi:very-short-patch-repair endonuclease